MRFGVLSMFVELHHRTLAAAPAIGFPRVSLGLGQASLIRARGAHRFQETQALRCLFGFTGRLSKY
jgi:hypothetical protein